MDSIDTILKYELFLGIDAKTMHEELTTTLGPNASSYRTVAKWTRRFRKVLIMILDQVIQYPS